MALVLSWENSLRGPDGGDLWGVRGPDAGSRAEAVAAGTAAQGWTGSATAAVTTTRTAPSRPLSRGRHLMDPRLSTQVPQAAVNAAGRRVRQVCRMGQGSSVNAAAWLGRTTVKSRWLRVAIRVAPCRSAKVMTEASVPPSRRLA
jgi:hypothetical protein